MGYYTNTNSWNSSVKIPVGWKLRNTSDTDSQSNHVPLRRLPPAGRGVPPAPLVLSPPLLPPDRTVGPPSEPPGSITSGFLIARDFSASGNSSATTSVGDNPFWTSA